MNAAIDASPSRRQPELLGQTVVVIGGSAGIGLETARRASTEGARLVLTGRDPGRLERAASELDALSSAAFDATDPASLERFFRDLPATIDHVMVTAGRPHYGRLIDLDFEQARRAVDEHILLMIQVARNARKVKPGGTLLFVGGTGARRPVVGLGMVSTITAALPVLTANLALELAPVRVNLIAAGGGALEWLPRLVGRSRALEFVLSADDFNADIAEAYGWVNRTLDDSDLDAFVDTLVRRLASFERETLGAAKAQINRFGMPTAAELQSSNEMIFPMLALPDAQARGPKQRGIGYGVPSDFELNFGRYLPGFGSSDDRGTDKQPG